MGNRIAEILTRHKGLAEALFLPAVVVLVGLTAFGLGRLSVIGEEGPRLIISTPPGSLVAGAQAPAEQPVQEGQYVASKTGTRYYLPSCSGASRIKEENRVWFATVAQARAAGYTAAANCPGLE